MYRHHNFEERLNIVSRFQSGEPLEPLCKELKMDKKMVRLWYLRYKKYGEEGLRGTRYSHYTADEKLAIVKEFVEKGVFLQALCLRYDLSRSAIKTRVRLYRQGLSLYLACLGLDARAHFFETVMRPEGALWIALGFIITFVPVVIMALLAMRVSKLDFGSACGMLCGSMANPMALNYANDTLPGDNPAVSYATVYPPAMFCRVIIAQVIVMMFV